MGTREFGFSSSDAAKVASIIHTVTQHNARRKPELWNSTTYSVLNYRECVPRYLVHLHGHRRDLPL